MPQVSPTSLITSEAAVVAAAVAVLLVLVQQRPVVQRRLAARLRPAVDNVALALLLEPLPLAVLVVARVAVGQPSIPPFWIR